ncbi:MAG TPA: GGDEF domain-containing protein, partial [Betaproteobacteria bacterium]|nr:GGDEF domain-containing protein [Betaproteobacteria bacterium]
ESARNKSEEYAESLEVMVQERTQQLEEMARTDPLTGLLNRRYLMEELSHAIHAAQRRGEALSLVYFDVNDFKEINDRNGHQYGDEVLRKIGGILLTIRRNEDRCYRYGGDEFCAVLSNCREQDAQEQFCQRLHEEIAKHLESVTLSTGISQTGPDNYEEASKLLELADARMYEAKRAYKASRQSGAV